ncbi:MAG: hypothetical protein ACNI3H_07795 [Halarcobacter ebronensis]
MVFRYGSIWFDTYTLGAAAKFDLDSVKLSMGIRHTDIDLDKSQTLLTAVDVDKNDDHSLTKVDLGGLKCWNFWCKRSLWLD